jgi:hypothetical protein
VLVKEHCTDRHRPSTCMLQREYLSLSAAKLWPPRACQPCMHHQMFGGGEGGGGRRCGAFRSLNSQSVVLADASDQTQQRACSSPPCQTLVSTLLHLP